MWKTFEINDNLYMSRVKQSKDVISIHLTDLKSVWFEEIPSETVLERFQILNPNFEIAQDEAVKQLCDLLENIDTDTKESEVSFLETEERTWSLKLKSRFSECPFVYEVIMALADISCFFKEVTVPFIHTIKYLEDQQQKLIDLIEKKDRELEEYRVEKGTITRSDLQTEKFKKDDLECSHEKLMMNVFKDSNFWSTFVEQNGRPQIETLSVVKDHWNQANRKRKIYSSKTVTKKQKGISYNNTNTSTDTDTK